MTLDEAIIKHIQIADSYHKAMPNYDEAADHIQLAEWLMELKDLRAEQNDQYVFIHELMSELKETKRLLKVAVDDIYKARQGCNCNICDMPPEPTERCQYENGEDCQFKWRYADEALKLIGDEPNGI